MHIENSPDFKTVWQLAHNWIGADLDKTNSNAISPELKTAIHRLMQAMSSMEITGRWKGFRIFMDNSFLSSIFDLYHTVKFYQCFRKNKFDKAYLDSFYIKRNEVLSWCKNVIYLDPPPCWVLKTISSNDDITAEVEDTDDENNGWYDKISKRRRQRIVCIELAKQLWEQYPGISYEEMHRHPTMEQLGYSSTFSFKSFKNLVRSVASEPAQLPGAPAKTKE
ncbi:hypothetical protein [Nitrosomonas ureae]|uniref:Uncharacterized protein n=1 Tax=Nitrosomonas ureae TaxID=44577 RepID=A0A1H2HJZ2_9PROT|nr:hypothetical protein [Nitrosomonas ureae]ALQ51146.1 hypothetical protein ATY38_07860 [Nitrosomonas ureae]SDU32163.1 hypothetical protein SAMN05216406_1533 [Nitrosomonas ureae]